MTYYVKYDADRQTTYLREKVVKFAWFPVKLERTKRVVDDWITVEGKTVPLYKWVWLRKYLATQEYRCTGHYQHGGYFGEQEVFKWVTVKRGAYTPLPKARALR